MVEYSRWPAILPGFNYAPLSPAAVTVAETILKSATYNGKAIL